MVIQLTYGLIGDELVSAMERTASQGYFRANLSKGGNGRSINLSDAETEMCIKAAKAVGLEFAGVDLIREKMGQTYVTEVNSNHGTGIIDITKNNYFIHLIKFVQAKFKKAAAVTAPVPLPDDDKEKKQQQENEEEASIKRYKELLSKEFKGKLSYSEGGMLSYFKKKLGSTFFK